MSLLTLNFNPEIFRKSGRHSIYGEIVTYSTSMCLFTVEVSEIKQATKTDGITHPPVSKFAQINSLKNFCQPSVMIFNTKKKTYCLFEYVSTDKDGSGEDTYGWKYKSVNAEKPCKLLIIND